MVTFETKVWEKDWEYLLRGNYIDTMISRCEYPFSKKHLIINNVKNRSLVEKYCDKKVKDGIIDSYFSVQDYADEVLNHFNIERESFKGGYNYSISELTGIYLCKTDFLLHFSSDSYIINNGKWIDEAISIMQQNRRVMVANPTWNNKYNEVRKESFDQLDNFYISFGFSDQCYLIRREDFMERIYNQKHIASERFPKYGGELFEKRVDSYMQNSNRFRITYKHSSYTSKNFPKNWLLRKFFRDHIAHHRFSLQDSTVQ